MLEQVERLFNGALTRLVTSNLHVTNGLQHTSTIADTSRQEARVIRILACSKQWSDHLAAVIGACARSLHLANSLILKSCLTDIDDSHKLETNISSAACLLVCWDEPSLTSDSDTLRQQIMHNFISTVQLAIARRANVLVLVASVPQSGGSQNGSSEENVARLVQHVPELTCVHTSKRLFPISRTEGQQADNALTQSMQLWLKGDLQPATPCENLPYRDIWQIACRQLGEQREAVDCVVRLGVMCVLGVLCVLSTLLLIGCLTQAQIKPSCSVVNDAVDYTKRVIEAQRTGKSEWGWRQTAVAVTALQLHQPHWFLIQPTNTRSVDRLEVRLLALLNGCRRRDGDCSEQLGPLVLAHFVNALSACFLDAGDFYGHDLPTTLDKYVSAHSNQMSAFTLSTATIALHNARFAPSPALFLAIAKQQRDDGGFVLGVDEALMCLMALSLAPGYGTYEVREASRRTEQYVLNSARSDGSFGNLYTTALALQAANSGVLSLTTDQLNATKRWVVGAVEHDKYYITNVDIASQVLIALSGKSILHIGRWSSDLAKLSASSKFEPEQETVEWESLDDKVMHHMTSDEMMTSALATAESTPEET